MKKLRISFAIALTTMLMMSSCTTRLVDFTVISSKNIALNFDKSDGKRTEGQSMNVFFIGVNIKDAIDDALQKAGPNYDMLVDGVLRSKQFPFYGGYVVEGTAINSRELQANLGQIGFEQFLAEHNVVTPETSEQLPVVE
jgi:hypothetical protein